MASGAGVLRLLLWLKKRFFRPQCAGLAYFLFLRVCGVGSGSDLGLVAFDSEYLFSFIFGWLACFLLYVCFFTRQIGLEAWRLHHLVGDYR